MRFSAVVACAVLFGTVPSPGQESVEGRLLQILKERGVITEAELAELQRLEKDLRVQGDLETRLGDRIDEMVARIDDEAPKTSYKPGSGFNWTTPDGKFSLTIQGRLQIRLTHEENTEDVPGAKFDENESNFDVQRARVLLFGHAFEPWWRFNIHFDVQGDTGRGPVSVAGGTPSVTSTGNFTSQNRLAELKDAFIEFTKWKPFNIRAGQFKVPYSRQQLTSSFKQEFVERSIVDRNFGAGRDHGLMFFGTLGGEKDDFFEYYAGIFDGEGENFVNNDDGLFYGGRIAVNPLGGVPYSESDVAGSEKFKIAIGANAWFHDNDNHNQAGARFDSWSVGGDLTMLWAGWFFTAEIHYREDEQATSDRETIGWFAQLGYFIIPHELEIGLRAANVDFDNSTTLSAQREYLVLLGYFIAEHNLKIQTDFGRVELHENDPTRNDDEWRLRIQATFVF